MKLLFITPPIKAWATHGNHKAPNQFYAQLAAYIRSRNVAEVSILDCRAFDLSYDQMIEEVKRINPDYVMFGDVLHSTGGLAIIWHFNESARLIKEALPKTKTIVGGLWYSAFYEETMAANPQIDFITIGEAELTLEELLNNLQKYSKPFSKIPGLVSRDENGRVHIGPHRSLIPDLNILPMPAYDLFPMEKYVGHTYWKPFAELMTSRGCPGGCHFCYEWSLYDPRSGSKDFTSWRGFSPSRIVDELELLEKKYGIHVIVFQDDAFNVNSEMVEAFCKEKIKRGNSVKWVCLGRADDWSRQKALIPLMAQAGLFMGLVGVEVSSDRELMRIGKGVTLQQIKDTVNSLRENNVATVGTVLIGLENDDEALIKERLHVADEIDPDILALDYVTPVPGSPVWKKSIKNGFFDPANINLKEWDFHHPVMPTKHLSIEDVGRLGAWCMREFYSKPQRIHRIMESDYDMLVKLCVKDFMNNIAKFEAASRREKIFV
ncbi:MAG: radical SAM protein [Candidatus Omnitrophica bacterium]|nr:radical SAM protein [Candidatus Omnitrophota bacterium]